MALCLKTFVQDKVIPLNLVQVLDNKSFPLIEDKAQALSNDTLQLKL